MDEYEPLFNHIRRFIKLHAAQEALLRSKLNYTRWSRKEVLLQEGQTCTNYYFVLSGCLRFYKNTESGVEQILQFGIPGWWISDFQSFETQKPSEYNIQAVHDTAVLTCNRVNFEELLILMPELHAYFRLMMQRAYTASLKKMELLLCESAEKRYCQFVTTFPDFVQGVPQYMLASFLGFTPQFLSMLRAKKVL